MADKVIYTVKESDSGKTLLAVLGENGIHINADCGGRGACGKCGVRFLSAAPEPFDWDKRAFDSEKLKDGWRLSCKAEAVPGDVIEISTHTDFEIESSFANGEARAIKGINGEKLVLGIDIGTTTVVMQLCGRESRRLYAERSFINPQKSFGGDVISRITASNSGKGVELKRLICEKLFSEYESIKKETGIADGDVECAAIGANSTMIHLLMGYDCSTLGVYPFTPVNISYGEFDFGEVLTGNKNGVVLKILPGISTFVGADITAGLVLCGFDRLEKPALFIDLGTNGEIAIGDKDGIAVSSTAAGPAFEGGNITYGTGSIPGAICGAEYNGKGFELTTIGGAEPAGICGTGIIEITAELIKNELIDETGRIEEKSDRINVAPGIDFLQKDIREVQLAKAAVCAGLMTLMKKKGLKAADIDKLYIAGGFGTKLNVKKAAETGLIPKGLEDKTAALGNSSLGGTLELLFGEPAERYISIADNAKEIALSTDSDFNYLYIDNMSFDTMEE